MPCPRIKDAAQSQGDLRETDELLAEEYDDLDAQFEIIEKALFSRADDIEQ